MFIVRFFCWKLIINFQLDKNGIDAMLPGLFALFCGLARFESLPSGSDARGYELGDVNRGGFVPFGFGQNGELPLWVCLYLHGTDGADMDRTIVGLY